MAKSKAQKSAWLHDLEQLFAGSATVFVNFSNLKAMEVDELRKAFRGIDSKLRVVKNSLLKKLLTERGITLPNAVLDQPIAAATGDEVVLSKTIANFKKDHPAVAFHGVIISSQFNGPEVIEKLSKLPSREQLLGMLVGTLVGPTRGLVTVLSGNLRGLVSVLSHIKPAG